MTPTATPTRIGVVGLGLIGTIWARHYQEAGLLAGTWNRTSTPEAPGWTTLLSDLAAASPVIQIVVADPPAVASVLDTVLPSLPANALIIQSSTIDAAASDQFHQRARKAGHRYVECPFTGSKPAAEARKLVYYCGGKVSDLAEAEPFLALLSDLRVHVGTHQQAAALKLAMNLNLACIMEALSESLTFARRAGISDDLFFAVLKRNVGLSGLATLKEPKLRDAEFAPHFSIKHMHKDVCLALKSGPLESLPLTTAVEDCFQRAEKAGLGDLDFASLIALLKP